MMQMEVRRATFHRYMPNFCNIDYLWSCLPTCFMILLGRRFAYKRSTDFGYGDTAIDHADSSLLHSLSCYNCLSYSCGAFTS